MKKLFFTLFALCMSITIWAYDFSATNNEKTIYYNIVSSDDRTCEVTYQYYEDANWDTYSGEITVPASVTYDSVDYSVIGIGNDAFDCCSGLTSVNFPSSLIYISEWAFWECSSLASIEIPSDVTSIGEGAFAECTSLKNVSLSENLSSIGGWAFRNCSSIEEITIPEKVESIDGWAFYNCTSMTKVTIPNSVGTIGDYAFSCCEKLADLTIGSGVTSLSGGVFSYCESLSFVTIPEGVTSIGNMAFGGCTSLTEVTIPNSVTSIEDWAFFNCKKLSSIDLPAGITAIKEYTFEYCEALTEVTIPCEVSSIGTGAFMACSSLSSVVLLNPEPPTYGTNILLNDNQEVKVSVPAGTMAVYKENGWESVANTALAELDYAVLKIVVSDGEDGYSTYYNADYDVTMPEGVTAYTASDVSGEEVILDAINGVVPAKTAVLLKGDVSNYTNVAVASPSANAIENNMLYGSEVETLTTGADDNTSYHFYKLTTQNNENLAFYWGADDGGAFNSTANKAWLAVPQTSSNGIRAFSLKFNDGEPDGITSIENVDKSTTKGIYTIQGVRVSDMNQKGIYIVDGKKVLVR